MTEEAKNKREVAKATKEQISYLYDFCILKKQFIGYAKSGKPKYARDPREAELREKFMSARNELRVENMAHDIKVREI